MVLNIRAKQQGEAEYKIDFSGGLWQSILFGPLDTKKTPFFNVKKGVVERKQMDYFLTIFSVSFWLPARMTAV